MTTAPAEVARQTSAPDLATTSNAGEESSGSVVRVPHQRLYWALIEASDEQARDQQFIAEQLVQKLPLPIESVQWSSVRIPGKVIVCAMERSELDAIVADGPLAAVPDHLPESLRGIEGVQAQAINLLIDAYLPREIVRATRRWRVVSIACVVIPLALAIVGLERSTAHALRRGENLAVATASLANQTLGKLSKTETPLDQLTRQLGVLRSTRTSEPPAETRRADEALALLLSVWPADMHARVEGLSVAPEGISLRLIADTRDEAVEIAEALRKVPSWTLSQPQVSAAEEFGPAAVRANLRLTPSTTPRPVGAQP